MGLLSPPLGSRLFVAKASALTFDLLQPAILAVFNGTSASSPGNNNRIFISMTTPVQDPATLEWKVYIVFQSPLTN